MKVRELIEELEGMDENAEVRLAHQPQWAFEYSIREVVECKPDDDQSWCEDHGCEIAECECNPDKVSRATEPVVYIGEGSQIGYLPGFAARALGWK